MDQEHPEHRPHGFSDTRYFYYALTGKVEGKCVTCGKPTEWNEETQKYNRFCNNPACKAKYKEVFNQRMIKKYGKVSLCDDPEQQRKMLKARRISGQYQFKDGGKVDYVGSYEKDFLKMMDMFMRFKSSDIMAPSPHTYSYQYEGETHFYIPDFFIPNLNLEIEIKDETTTHPKFLAVDKVKETGLSLAFTENGNPYFKESRLTLECELLYVSKIEEQHFKNPELFGRWYNEKAGNPHIVYIAEIVRAWEK